jgi:hypothetical protein
LGEDEAIDVTGKRASQQRCWGVRGVVTSCPELREAIPSPFEKSVMVMDELKDSKWEKPNAKQKPELCNCVKKYEILFGFMWFYAYLWCIKKLKTMINEHTVIGTLYSKVLTKKPNKKNPSMPDWEFWSVLIEQEVQMGAKQIKNVAEFSVGLGVNIDRFEVGDRIEASFNILGKQISTTWLKTEVKINHMKFADLERAKEKQAEENPFTPTETPEGEEDLDELPF